MLKAVITNDLPPPPEIEANASIFSSPSQTKLNFLEQLLKWLLTQNMDENLKVQLYQDALSKAPAINNNNNNNNIQSEKITEDIPVEPDISFYKNQYFILKKRLEDLTKSPPPTSIYTLQKARKRKATSFVSNKYKRFSRKEPIY